MKRLLTTTAALVLVMAVASQASETRGMTMGDANNIIKDPGNIWLYPSTIGMYPDQAEAVFNNNGNFTELFRVGAHFEFNASNPFVLGVYVIDDDHLSLNSFFSPPASLLGATNTNRSFNVFWGKNWNGNPFGVHFRLHRNSFEDESATGTIDQSLTNFFANFGLTTSGGNVDWALAFFYTTWNDDATLIQPDGNYGAILRARKWNSVNSKLTWIWHGLLAYEKQGAEIGPLISKITDYIGDVGLGLNYTATSKALFVLDFGISYESAKVEDDTAGVLAQDIKVKDAMLPYWRVGMDGEVWDWLDLRFGATNNWRFASVETTDPTSSLKDSESGSTVQSFLGAGLHFGSNHQFEIDCWVDPDWVLNGPGFISDNQNDSSNDDMFTEVTFTYYFRQ